MTPLTPIFSLGQIFRLDRERAAFLLDSERRTFLYRTSRAPWLLPPEQVEEFKRAIEGLVGDDLNCPAVQKKHRDGDRGSHFPCIIGHQRQYAEVSRAPSFSPLS
jgi:hypothetical protein